jgi:predicted Fe-Mo cluster-binding NifX family protein
MHLAHRIITKHAFEELIVTERMDPYWKGISMKIAISAMDPNLDSEVDPRFGRSQYFILVDPETMQFESLTNPNLEAPSGAGIITAQLIYNKGASAVITGTIGPKAHQALAAAGVRMLMGVSGTIRDAIESFKAGKLLGDSDAGAGIGGGAGTRGGAGMGRGIGTGGGSGRGGGMGRGEGRGMGCGGGKGMGMGPGRGGGGGRAAPREGVAEPRSARMNQPSGPDELSFLKQQANKLADELTRILQRIEQLEKQ